MPAKSRTIALRVINGAGELQEERASIIERQVVADKLGFGKRHIRPTRAYEGRQYGRTAARRDDIAMETGEAVSPARDPHWLAWGRYAVYSAAATGVRAKANELFSNNTMKAIAVGVSIVVFLCCIILAGMNAKAQEEAANANQGGANAQTQAPESAETGPGTGATDPETASEGQGAAGPGETGDGGDSAPAGAADPGP